MTSSKELLDELQAELPQANHRPRPVERPARKDRSRPHFIGADPDQAAGRSGKAGVAWTSARHLPNEAGDKRRLAR